MEIDAMLAGQELDTLVAEKVMGQVPCDMWNAQYGGWAMAIIGDGAIFINSGCPHSKNSCYPRGHPSGYSSNIALAWKVMEKMQSLDDDDFVGFCSFLEDTNNTSYLHQSSSLEAALLICRAALKAIETTRIESC